jgi:hypothetical protein
MRVVAVPAAEHRADPRFAIADVRLDSLLQLGDGRVEQLLALGTVPGAG